MEGKFYRHKSPYHPHTNAAKAALNMLTRTSAQDYAKDRIYMNSVDTGWINVPTHSSHSSRRTRTRGTAQSACMHACMPRSGVRLADLRSVRQIYVCVRVQAVVKNAIFVCPL